MPFSAAQIAARSVAVEKEVKAAKNQRQTERQRTEARARLIEQLMREYPGIYEHTLLQMWSCAINLTNKLLDQFEKGRKKLSASQLVWHSVLSASDYTWNGALADERLAIITQMARSYNDISQEFTAKFVNNSELPVEEKSDDWQSRITATAPVPE